MTPTIQELRSGALRRLNENQQHRPALALEAARGSADAAARLDELDADDAQIQRQILRFQAAEAEAARVDALAAEDAARERDQRLRAQVAVQESIRHEAFRSIDTLVDSLVDQTRIALRAVDDLETLNAALGRPAGATSQRWVAVRRIAQRVVGGFWTVQPGVLPAGDARPLAGEGQS